jgi:hypothetical protein
MNKFHKIFKFKINIFNINRNVTKYTPIYLKNNSNSNSFYKQSQFGLKTTDKVEVDNQETNLLNKIGRYVISYKFTLFNVMGIIIFSIYGHYTLSIIFTFTSILIYYKESQSFSRKIQNFIDQSFTKQKNHQILYAEEMIKKYICRHPELSKIFPENKSTISRTTWHRYKENYLGSSKNVYEESLVSKRWHIASVIDNEEYSERHARITSIVLFHTPTHFVIEYLRVDADNPFKRHTVIDGRRESKDWVEELNDSKINKRAYPRFRENDSVKHL